jgi:hypothetical protein
MPPSPKAAAAAARLAMRVTPSAAPFSPMAAQPSTPPVPAPLTELVTS